MHLEHEFVVPVPVKQAWDVLLEIERIAPCMPGATLEAVHGDSFDGRVKVKVGPITVTYNGSAAFTQQDVDARRVTIKAAGREARGSGTAAATIDAVLHDEGERTRVTVDTELAVTGRPAQFGRGVMMDVSNKLLRMFADCLEQTLATTDRQPVAGADTAIDTSSASPASVATPSDRSVAGPGAVSAEQVAVPPAQAATPSGAPTEAPSKAPSAPRVSAPPVSAQRPTPEAIDLLEAAGVPVLKRVAPALVAVGLLVLLWRVLRGRRS